MDRNKKKGYALATVIILILLMTIVITSAFTIIMRYMAFARDGLEDMGTQDKGFYEGEAVDYDSI